MKNPNTIANLAALKELYSAAVEQSGVLGRQAEKTSTEARRLRAEAADLERRGKPDPELAAKAEQAGKAADEVYEAAAKARADADAMNGEIAALEIELRAFGGTTREDVAAKQAECDDLAAEIGRLEELAAEIAAGASEANQARLDELLAQRPAILAEIIAGTGEFDDSDLAALDAEIAEAQKLVQQEKAAATDRADTLAGLNAKADALRATLAERRAELDRLTEDYRLGVALQFAGRYLKALDAAAAARIELLSLKAIWPAQLREMWLPEFDRPRGFAAFHSIPANHFATQPAAIDAAKARLTKSLGEA